MKQLLIVTIAIVLFASTAFAANFAPTPLRLSAPEIIYYDTVTPGDLSFDLSVTGKQATVVFLVFTKGQADNILDIQNGFLGWHYVHKIDTCIFESAPFTVDLGTNAVTWDGKDDDGNTVPDEEYTYYIAGFDHVTMREMSEGETDSSLKGNFIQEVDESGAALPNPIICRKFSRWTLGSDPAEAALTETSKINRPEGWKGSNSGYFNQPDDFDYIYTAGINTDAATGALMKWKWVPGGDAELQTGWAESGFVTYPYGTSTYGQAVSLADGGYCVLSPMNYKTGEVGVEHTVVEYVDGYIEGNIDDTRFWGDINDLNSGAQANGGVDTSSWRNGYSVLGTSKACQAQIINITRWLEQDPEDYILWVNDNGDYILDHNEQPDSATPWVCNDFNVGPYRYSNYADDNLFYYGSLQGAGAVTFGLLAPDGTGIGYMTAAGEVSAGSKRGVVVCDNGSIFDGLYTSKVVGEANVAGLYYIGCESIKGTLSLGPVAVDNAEPSGFSVAQNSPNPFNPTTAINYSLARDGNVTLDIFNVAGQKIDTIVKNEFRSAGPNSAIWDASGFSAGVYFYTVKSGSFSKTMKMTLLK